MGQGLGSGVAGRPDAVNPSPHAVSADPARPRAPGVRRSAAGKPWPPAPYHSRARCRSRPPCPAFAHGTAGRATRTFLACGHRPPFSGDAHHRPPTGPGCAGRGPAEGRRSPAGAAAGTAARRAAGPARRCGSFLSPPGCGLPQDPGEFGRRKNHAPPLFRTLIGERTQSRPPFLGRPHSKRFTKSHAFGRQHHPLCPSHKEPGRGMFPTPVL